MNDKRGYWALGEWDIAKNWQPMKTTVVLNRPTSDHCSYTADNISNLGITNCGTRGANEHNELA